MDSLFGIPLTSILVTLLLALGGILGIIVLIGVRHPLFVRMGLRNIRRRRSQTLLIVIGLMLSTLIISAAFATGDTVGYSITNQFFEDFEEADFVLGFDQDLVVERDARFLTDEFLAALAAEYGPDPAFDGVAGLLVETLPVVNPQRRLAEPEASVVGVDAADIDSFRGLRTADGTELSAATLGGRRAYISQDLADEIDAAEGDTIDLLFDGAPTPFEVIGVVRDTSITGAGADPTAGGVVVDVAALRELTGSEGKITFVVLSITGGVRDTLDESSALEDRIEDFLLAHPDGQAEIVITKAEAIEIAETVGSVFVTFFLVFGLFAIAAGVLLIFLIFVMLAAERRSEMGMARAVGMQRLHLTEAFLAEGVAYDLGSAAVGSVLGLGVAFLLIQVLSTIGDDFGLSIAFHFNWQGFLIAYSLGVVLTFVTVAFSSFRVANLNIVRAIRDLPEPQPLRGASRSVGGLLQAGVGVLWFVAWLVLITIWASIGIIAATSVLAQFGDLPTVVSGVIGFVVLLDLGAFMVFGARTVRRGHVRGSSWRGWLLRVAWLVVFNALALITWGLLLSRGWAARHRNAGGWAVLMVLLGLLLVWLAGWGLDSAFFSWWQGRAFAYTSGVTLGLMAFGMLAVYFGVAPRPAFSVAGLALLWYWLLPLPFSLFADIGDANDLDPIDGLVRLLGLPRPEGQDGNIEMFFVSGIAMTASAVLVIIFNAESGLAVVRWAGNLLGGIAPAVKTAVAYPLAAKFRTGMTLAMFGLVVFSLVVMATLNFNFTQVFLGEEASGGFDVAVNVNPNNRIPDLRATLAEGGYREQEAIAGVGRMRAAFPQVRIEGGEFDGYRLNGVDDEFVRLQEMPLDHRAIGYESDEAVWEAIRTNPTFAVIDASRLERDDGPFSDDGESDFVLGVTSEELREAPWQPISLTLRDPASGETMRLRVIGVLEPQVASVILEFTGIFTNDANLDETFGGGEVEDYFLITAEPTDAAATEVARAVESTLLEIGVQAESIDKLINDAAALSRSFQLLFEGFMALGLIVGIAALGVIAFRTVVERRQQIGMLRAIGYSRRLVALSYFLESSFIALAGVAIGLLLGVALSYNLLTSDEFTDGADVNFQIPWLRLAIIIGVAYGASALMTLLPARAAARVAAAEARRYE
ncbi:MAG: FtsX-like permease family protein [Chloroflexi bacterium]|nr:FtsX-like permease family protein [Chloroflexota bacterium]